MVGTCALQQPNALHLVEFTEDSAEVICRQTLPHEDEVWALAVSPTDGRNVLTYAAGGSQPALRLWRTGDQESSESSLQVSHEGVTYADDEAKLEGVVKSLLWDPHKEDSVVAADAESLHIFQLGSGRFTRSLGFNVGQRCNGACLDPHHQQQASTVDDTHLKTWDFRTSGGEPCFKRDGVHLFGARDVDYNPNVPYQVMTTGDDATIRFWDLRNLSECRRALSGGHHHWIARARYNSHHDQLVLSCGTDSAVCLWRASSVASKPLGAESPSEDASNNTQPLDTLIKRFEDYEDSCYSCCWSAADAWVFAAVSFDGKLVVNRVPGEEKYRILL